ncbi:C40 family peptidase [Liquorilactobacillus mali]|uniref:Cell wall hydrolase n=1 Tax=Liquorilactobacillus mali KCTC 3596 = DSM 20444 TaxID=1046596 RepID=J1F4D3_9LACO|nr:NlpC/P60 family protein [Liquorilactobacillus mali]EJF00684.1 cell wall hydrolase mobile element region [Liquorilactobacillus mali KCTC 3596 = DSM 20444]KRN08936.1 cell wall hydrolase [Liquorilactobacillus mali KCTC 3596 = DSM 20444]MDC7954079.1 C40 family peptidase [Liquorilactobacillus mali]QFQ75729.1 cell wall hydrolase [Liquorilactobacillus mali]
MENVVKKKAKHSLIFILLPFILIGFVLVGTALLVSLSGGGIGTDTSTNTTLSTGSSKGLSAKTLRFKDQIQAEMEKQNVPTSWLGVLLAHVEVETHGNAEKYPDIFQASESVKGANVTNALTTEQSIHYGVLAFKNQLASVKSITGHDPSPTNEGDVNITSVLYNAPAFGPWLKKNHGGQWSVEANNDFYKNVLPSYGAGSGDSNYWKKILQYYDPSTGQSVTASTVTVSGESESYFNTVIAEAKKYEGNPYVWGGSNPTTGFDCSGLVQWCFKKAGITLPRTSQQQWSDVTEISESQAKAGDLVFFEGTDNQGGMTHVGIYLGNGKMSNAEKSGVKVANLSAWQKLYKTHFGKIKGAN